MLRRWSPGDALAQKDERVGKRDATKRLENMVVEEKEQEKDGEQDGVTEMATRKKKRRKRRRDGESEGEKRVNAWREGEMTAKEKRVAERRGD